MIYYSTFFVNKPYIRNPINRFVDRLLRKIPIRWLRLTLAACYVPFALVFMFIGWVLVGLWHFFTALLGALWEVFKFAARWVIICAILAFFSMLVAEYIIQRTEGDGMPRYEYQAFIEGKIAKSLGGEMKAALVRFDVHMEKGTEQIRAFLSAQQVLDLEELPTLTFQKMGDYGYRIRELGVTTVETR